MRFYTEFLVGLVMLLNGCATVESDSGRDGPMTVNADRMTPKVNAQSSRAFGIEVITLSRGRGVPSTTREAYAQIKALVNEEARRGAAITKSEKIIGLEGERRFCVSLPDPETGRKLLERIETLSAGVELLQVIENGCGAKK